MTTCPYGFRIVGATWEARRLVDATAALAGYAACDERADVTREGGFPPLLLDPIDFAGLFMRRQQELAAQTAKS